MPYQDFRVLSDQVRPSKILFERPILDDICLTEIDVNEVSAAAARNVAGVVSVTSTAACVERRPKEVKETSLLPGSFQPTIC